MSPHPKRWFYSPHTSGFFCAYDLRLCLPTSAKGGVPVRHRITGQPNNPLGDSLMSNEKESKKSGKPKRLNPGKRGGVRPGAGRPKGSLDTGTRLIREMVVEALDHAGGVAYLASVAQSNPSAFLSLVGKVMPVQVEGSGGGLIQISEIRLVPLKNGKP